MAQPAAVPDHPAVPQPGFCHPRHAASGARDMVVISDILVQGVQMLLVLLLAPLLTGFVRKVKARLVRRKGPSVFQPYRDLLRLLRKEVVLAENASWLFRVTPYVTFAAIWVAAALVPTFATGLLFNWTADLIAIVALLGSARFFLALAGMDVGTSFGGIGSSREVMIAALAEPAMLLFVFCMALVAGSTQLSTVANFMASSHVGLRVSLGMAMIALIMVALAENARIPVDNPATHLELTMVHEAMVLEYSGRHLAMIEFGAFLNSSARRSCWVCSAHCCCSCRGASDADAQPLLRRLAYARRQPRPDQLHDAVPGPALFAAQRLRTPCPGARAFRGLAGLCPGRAASLRYCGHRPCLQGDRHSGGAAPHRQAAWDLPRHRIGRGYRPDHAGRDGAGRPLDGPDAAGDRRGRPAGARGPRLRIVGGAARAAGHGDPPQRRQSGGGIHVARERTGAGGHRRQGHATGRRDQRGVLDPDRLHRHRHLPVSNPRTLRLRGRVRARPLPGRTGMSTASFDAVAAVLLIPIGSAALLAILPGYRLTARLNVVASLATFLAALSLLLIERPQPTPYVLVDDLNIVFIVLNTFVGFTTSIFSASYIAHELETGRLTPVYLRFYHAMYQTMMFGMNLAFVSNNIGLMWVAVEIATLTTVLMVGIYRTHAALEAAWKYFILGSVGIGFALFGTILVYMAARPVVGEGQDGMIWTLLIQHAADFDPALLNVAFIFLFLGYGTKVGLAPLHAWLPDAHAEGPTPISAVLSGLLLNVALYALLRFKILLAANPAAIAPGPLMVTMGLVSLVFAAFMLYRRRDIKRLFAYSSIEHMGIIVFAFGMGGPLANFAGLLHMVMHSLTKSAIFYAVGHISQIKGTQRIGRIRGLTVTHPVLGWGLVMGVVAIAGLPPLGIFMSEFLVVSSTFARQPLLAIVLVMGLLLAFGALMLRLTSVAFGEPRGSTASAEASYVPMFAHLSLVLVAGIYLPAPLVVWFQHVARLLG